MFKKVLMVITLAVSFMGGAATSAYYEFSTDKIALVIDAWGEVNRETRLIWRSDVNALTEVCDIKITCVSD